MSRVQLDILKNGLGCKLTLRIEQLHNCPDGNVLERRITTSQKTVQVSV